MFKGVNEKLEQAGYFLNNLKTLAEDAGGVARILSDKSQDMRANLDGFFFEIISAKDFFLQGINDKYVKLPKDEATKIDQLKRCLGCLKYAHALEVVKSIEKELSDKSSWLWRLNNYRNSATHRELLRYWYITEGPTIEVKEGEEPVFQIVLEHETKIPTYLKRIDISSENYKFKDTKVYLLEDPEDQSQGNANIEVIPYCEESLRNMSEFLEKLYSELSI